MIKLSILIPSVHTRYNTFLPKIQEQVYTQYNALSEFDQSRVEIIVLSDTKSIMLGEKRNIMVDLAKGDYISFVDDDDVISDDYISSLLDATKSGSDVITFIAMVSMNGEYAKPCFYSKDNKFDFNKPGAYYRIPNHICCVKKEVSLKSSFPSLLKGEDSGYSRLLIRHLNTETKLNKVLYHYNYSDETTETQEPIATSLMRRRDQKPIVDVVIISSAKNRSLYSMTQKAIDTCIAGANSLPVNVIVVEQVPGVRYKNAKVIYGDRIFNYNRAANKGAVLGFAEWIMIANNDLLFKSGWLHSLLVANHPIMSPKCPNDYRQTDVSVDEIGDVNGRNISGWCFMIKRSLYDQIGHFSEDMRFWGSDDVTIEQVRDLGVLPMLVVDSLVTHLGSTTLGTVDPSTRNDLTWKDINTFNDKYGKSKFADNKDFINWKIKNGIK